MMRSAPLDPSDTPLAHVLLCTFARLSRLAGLASEELPWPHRARRYGKPLASLLPPHEGVWRTRCVHAPSAAAWLAALVARCWAQLGCRQIALTLTDILRGGCCACRRACLGAACGGRACAEEVVLKWLVQPQFTLGLVSCILCVAAPYSCRPRAWASCVLGLAVPPRSSGDAVCVQRSAICRRGGVGPVLPDQGRRGWLAGSAGRHGDFCGSCGAVHSRCMSLGKPQGALLGLWLGIGGSSYRLLTAYARLGTGSACPESAGTLW